MTPEERFIDAQNYKNVCPKVFDSIYKILKMRETFFVIVLYMLQLEDAHRLLIS